MKILQDLNALEPPETQDENHPPLLFACESPKRELQCLSLIRRQKNGVTTMKLVLRKHAAE